MTKKGRESKRVDKLSENELVKSSARTLDILTLLANKSEGMKLTDIGEELGIPLSSIYGLIKTLERKGFLLHNSRNSQYLLGPKILQLSHLFRSQLDLVKYAEPVMDRLRRVTSETTSLSVLQGDKIVFIHKRIAEEVLRVVNPVGTTLYAHATGSGKVLLAFLNEEEVEQIYRNEKLTKVTPNTIGLKSDLMSRLAEIRKCNYAYDDEESELGVWAVASCILSEAERPLAALSIVGPTNRISKKDTSDWNQLVREGAREISLKLHGKVPNPRKECDHDN